MALSELEQARITKRLSAYCESRLSMHAINEVRLGFRIHGHDVVLFEERPSFHPPHQWQEYPVAKFKYVATQRHWQLYCRHRDLRWHEYRRRPSARVFDVLLDEVDADPTGIFWG